MYKWQRIKALHAQGVSIRQIAATVGVSRNTVRKYLREAGPPQFKAREYVKELDNYKEAIKDMLPAQGKIESFNRNSVTRLKFYPFLHHYKLAIITLRWVNFICIWRINSIDYQQARPQSGPGGG